MSAFAAVVAAARPAAPRRVSEKRAVRASRTRVAAMSPSMPVAPELPLPDFLREPLKQAAERLDEALPADTKKQVLRAQYTSAIGLRLAFFLSQGVLSSRVSGSSNIDGAAAAAAIVKAVLEPEPRARIPDADSKIGNIARNAADGRALTDAEAAEVSQFLEQHLTCIVNLFRDELAHLEDGVYKFPYDLNPATAPASQWNPVDVFSLSRDTLTDQSDVSKRRDEKAGQELLEKFAPDPERYPAYYLQNFHYQTDGWLSADSARLYDFQVETLFLGSADTMRRQVLPSVAKWARAHHDANGGADGAGLNILDVASGTGRFLTFVRDNWPAANYTALELSPHYLEATRVSNKRFEDVDGAGSLTLVEANCEAMPFPDASFDAVTNVYLFHEMPKEARRQAACEFARVLKPGGKLFFVDSAQVGDGKSLGMEKAFDQALERFPQFNHEPYYRDYSVTDLEALFGEFGLVAEEPPVVAWVSKCWAFTKVETTSENAPTEAKEEEVPLEVVEPVMVDEPNEAA